MTIFTKLTLTTAAVAALFSCSGGDDTDTRIDRALTLAGDNRPQLERVLNHYRDSGDHEKLAAARYLIANMPGHRSLQPDSAISTYYSEVDSIITAMKGHPSRAICDSINAVASRHDFSHVKTVADVKIITDSFLIANIDTAFSQWRDGPWSRHLTFDEFCEYLLPYKAYELQPLDEWRSMYAYVNSRHLAHIADCDMQAHSSYFAADFLQRYIEAKYHPEIAMFAPNVTVYDPRIAAKMPFGDCNAYSAVGAAVARSVGIPVVIDYTPVRANENVGHSWNALSRPGGPDIPFNVMVDNPSRQHMPESQMAKVFRRTFATNPLREQLNSTRGYVPDNFRDIFVTDVTSQYARCTDVEVVAPTLDDKYLFLATSNADGWVAVDFAPLKGGKARFRDVGLGCVYMPVYFTSDEQMHPASVPFYLNFDGTQHKFTPQSDKPQSITVDRKHPVREYVHHTAMKTEGAVFEASAYPDFHDAIIAHTITGADSHTHDVTLPGTIGAYRYWRYRARAVDSFCNIAEIAFYGHDGRELRGSIIGTAEVNPANPSATKEKAFDDNVLTYFDATAPVGAWVGMDFGVPVKVGKLRYTPRGDGNNVEPGDNYELLYMTTEGWLSAGRQTATGISVTFDNVPSGTLLLLVDRTKGREHRIFTMVDGRQHFF